MKSSEFAEKENEIETEYALETELKDNGQNETKKITKSFEDLLDEVDIEKDYNYDDVSLSLISDILIEIKRMLSKKHNQILSASRVSRDLNDLLLLLSDTSCTKNDFENIKVLILKLHSLLVSYLDNRNDSDLEQMIDVLLQLKDKNKILVDNIKELNKTVAGQSLLGYYGRNVELLKVQTKTNKLINSVVSQEIKEKYPSLELYDYSELDEAYKKLYDAIKNDDAEGITNTRGALIKLLKKHNSDIKRHAQDLKTIIDVYKVIDISSIDLNTKVSRIKEIVKKEKNPEIRKMIEDNLENYREFKKEFYELYNLLEVKKTELYRNALKEELKAHGEFLKKRYNDEVLSKRFSITQTIPKGIAFSIKKLANSISRLKYNEYARKRKSLIKEAVLDATRVISVSGVSALKFGAENWYTIYLVSNGVITINNERNDAANSYKELNPNVSDEEALKHVDDTAKNTPYKQQTVEYKKLVLDRENAINTYMRTHAGVTREQAEETVDRNKETTPYDEQSTNYQNEYNASRTESEASDKERAIQGYMRAYGVSEEEAIEAVEKNSSAASYETQARTYEDIANRNSEGPVDNQEPTPQGPSNTSGNEHRPEIELSDKEKAIQGYMDAYGVSEEEATEAVEKNARVTSYENQARTYADIAKNNEQTPDDNQEQEPEQQVEPEVPEVPPVEDNQESPFEEKNEVLDVLDNSLGNCTTFDDKETGEKVVVIFADDGKYYTMRYDEENNPIDATPVPLENIDDIRNNDNLVLSEEMIDYYDIPEIPNETMIKNLNVGGSLVYTYGEDDNQTVNVTRIDDDTFKVETIDNSDGQVVSDETVSLKDNPDYFAEFDEEYNEELGKLYTLQPGEYAPADNNVPANEVNTPQAPVNVPHNEHRPESELSDKERAIQGYMDAYGVNEEEATAAVEKNARVTSYENQARTYEDIAKKQAAEQPQDQENANPELINQPPVTEEQNTAIAEKNEALEFIGNSLGNCTTLENKETGEKVVVIFADDGKYYKMRYDEHNNPIDASPVPLENMDEIRNNDNLVLSEEMIDYYDLPEIPNETIILNLEVGSKIVYTYGEDDNQTVNIVRLDDDRFFVQTIDNADGEIASEEIVSLKDQPGYFAEFDEEYNERLGNLHTLQPGSVTKLNSDELLNLGKPEVIEEPNEEEQNEPVPYYDPNLEHLNFEAARNRAMNKLTNMASGDVVVVDYAPGEESHTIVVYKIGDAYYTLDANDIVDVDALYERELANSAPGNIPYHQTWENANSPDSLRHKFVRLDSLDDLQGCTLSDEEIRIPQAPPSFYLSELNEGETVTFKRDDGSLVNYKMGKDGRIYYSDYQEGETPVDPALIIDNTYVDRDGHINYAYSNQDDMDIGMDDLIGQFETLEPGQSMTLGFVEDLTGPLTVVSMAHNGKFNLYTNYGTDKQTCTTYETAAELAKDGLDKVIPQVLTDQYGNMPNGIGQYVDIPIWIRPDFYNAAPLANVRVVLYNGHIIGFKVMDGWNPSAVDDILNGENPIHNGFK